MQNRYEALESSRSLTLLPGSDRQRENVAAKTTRSGPRPETGFLAQLLAVKHDAPEYRARRRTEPHLAMAAYGALRKPVPRPGAAGIAA
jgi:hypothetical protein